MSGSPSVQLSVRIAGMAYRWEIVEGYKLRVRDFCLTTIHDLTQSSSYPRFTLHCDKRHVYIANI